ncbi:MAG: tol-pal system protein YbgF [Nitrospiria bacterium]
MMGLKTHAVLAKGMGLFLFASGCALQSSMVDIEDENVRLKKHQLQLQRRIERLERDQKSPSLIVKNQQALSAELVAQQGVTEEKVRTFSGEVTEARHLVSKLENRLDAESFRTKGVLSRLDVLEQRIVVLEMAQAEKEDASKEEEGDASRRFSSTKGEKTFFAPRDAFNLAYNDYVKGSYNVAIIAFDAFVKEYPTSRLVPQAYYWSGESHYGKGDYASAIEFFKKVIDEHPKSERVSKSLLKVGFSYLELKQPGEGKRYLEKVITRFPNSNEAALARDALVSLGKKSRP